MSKYIHSAVILLFCIACSSNHAKYSKVYKESDGMEVIELKNPYQEKLQNKLANYRRLSSHTIYDNENEITKFKRQKTTNIIRKIASEGPEKLQPKNKFQTYTVASDDNLGFVALKLLGSREDWKKLQGWNQELLPSPDKLKAGMVLRYIPKPTPAETVK